MRPYRVVSSMEGFVAALSRGDASACAGFLQEGLSANASSEVFV
jgi:hypothetical protein